VVVEADRRTAEERRKAVSEFVRGLSDETRRGRLARWDRTVCPGVVGLPAKYGSYIVDRIAMEALQIGLDVGRPGCRPNILILVTNRADVAAQALEAEHRRFFADRPRGMSLLSGGGSQTVESFVNTPRPVRWWHVAELATTDGKPINTVQLGRDPTKRVLALESAGGSRLHAKVKENLSRVLIIVDTARMRGVTYEALASYLAMVSLAQIEAAPEPGELDSILDIFAARDAGRPLPETLTAWDRAYLKGLYAAPADARNLNAQRGAIRRSLEAARGR
jgi:hypothetical protein